MSRRRKHDLSKKPDAVRRKTIWDKGPLAHIPNRVVRRPLKIVRAGVTIPSMLFRSSRSKVRLDLPDFLGIGGARCGTTWLHFNLDAHPEVSMPARKELRFWDRNLSWGLARYASHFNAASGQIVGEVTPGYGIMELWRVKLMARVLPDLRLVYIIRDPVDRAWSHLHMWSRNRRLSPDALSHEQVIDILTSVPCTRHGLYSETYEAYATAFGPEQIFVGFYDDLQERPQALLHEILEHIGATTDIDWDLLPLERHYNSGIGIGAQESTSTTTMPDVYRRLLSERYQSELHHLAESFGGPAVDWASKAQSHLR